MQRGVQDWLKHWGSYLDRTPIEDVLNLLPQRASREIATSWAATARPDQRPPIEDEGHQRYVDWNIWLFMGGRGAGKTRAGAEWVRERALGLHDGARDKPPVSIALVGPTQAEVRSVMVEGVSGLLSLNWDDGDRPVFESSRRLITWPNGSQAQIFTAEDPDGLRGPQFHAAWCDGRVRSPIICSRQKS